MLPQSPLASPQHLPRRGYPYASWWSRVGAYLIDYLLAVVPTVIVVCVGLVIATEPTRSARQQFYSSVDAAPNMLGLMIAVFGFFVYLAIAVSNQVVLQGRTGQSLGKKSVGIAVLEEATGRPLGVSPALVRWGTQLTIHVVGNHLLLGIPGLLNSLWPLWDAKNQTWHDKAVRSVVVRIHP
ncbi:RDD family protein [Nocardia gipuzkoensis]|uniref:RDD family protein n=1 Tax=Nocardia gipuzkoensis TaxID=2749991 RepID=UPI0015EF6084|nr:RDD family protein [Nocardia gipuzkoensis]